jgi:hypothetical protein
MDANIEAIMINTIIERKILIRSESIAILKLLNILLTFSNFCKIPQAWLKRTNYYITHKSIYCIFLNN